MNNNEANLLKVLKAAVNPGTKLELSPAVDLDTILKISAKHNIFPLVVDTLLERSDYASEIDMAMKNITIHESVAQIRKNNQFFYTYKVLNEYNIFPIVLKGIICRKLYGSKENLRPSSDEDIYISVSEFKGVHSILNKLGYACEFKDISDDMITNTQEITYYHIPTKLSIEVHINVFGKDSKFHEGMNRYFDDVSSRSIWETIETVSLGKISLRTLSHTDHFLFLILHAFKHFVVQGFGLRQLLDILMFYRSYCGDIDCNYVVECLKTAKAVDFYSDLVHIGNRYLGFELEAPTKSTCANALLDDLLESGIFGNGTQAQRTAQGLTRAALDQAGKHSGRIKMMWSTIFPSLNTMAVFFPELLDRPYRLPITWVIRWFHLVQHIRDNDNNLVSASMNIANARINLITKYGIYD